MTCCQLRRLRLFLWLLPIIIIDPFSSLAVIGNPLSSAEHLEDLYNWQNHHRVSEFLTAFTTFAFGIWASKKNRFYWRWSFCHSCGRCKSAKICVGHAMSRSKSLPKLLSNFRNYHRPICLFMFHFQRQYGIWHV